MPESKYYHLAKLALQATSLLLTGVLVACLAVVMSYHLGLKKST